MANYTVSGSPESELLRLFTKDFYEGQLELKKIEQEYYGETDDTTKRHLAQRYSTAYNALKRKQISFIVEHKEQNRHKRSNTHQIDHSRAEGRENDHREATTPHVRYEIIDLAQIHFVE
jgi:hypothetical protein